MEKSLDLIIDKVKEKIQLYEKIKEKKYYRLKNKGSDDETTIDFND